MRLRRKRWTQAAIAQGTAAGGDVPRPDERADVVAELPQPIGRALDVGCGEGGVGRSLRAAGATWGSGIEIVPAAAEVARGIAKSKQVAAEPGGEIEEDHYGVLGASRHGPLSEAYVAASRARRPDLLRAVGSAPFCPGLEPRDRLRDSGSGGPLGTTGPRNGCLSLALVSEQSIHIIAWSVELCASGRGARGRARGRGRGAASPPTSARATRRA